MATSGWMHLALMALATAAAGCGAADERMPADGEDTVVIELTPLGASGNLHAWRATYPAGGSFRIELELPAGATTPGFARGTLVREDGADCTPFLQSLARALGARGVLPRPAEGYRRLPFGTAILGQNLSRGTSGAQVLAGAFTSEPAGTWVATKLFLGEEEAEVFLGLSSEAGWGEFARKDPDYANGVMQAFAQVLAGPVTADQPPGPATPAPAAPTPSSEPTPDPMLLEHVRIVTAPSEEERGLKRIQSIGRLGFRGEKDRDVSLPALVQVLAEPGSGVEQARAIDSLAKVDPSLSACETEIRARLADGDRFVRLAAATALTEAYKQGGVLPVIAELLGNDEHGETVQGYAARLVPKLTDDVEALVPVLVKLTAPHRHAWLRYEAIAALGALGPRAAEAAALLQVYTSDTDANIARAAREALRRVQSGG